MDPRHTTKRIIPWDGYCHVHQGILPRDVREERRIHPGRRRLGPSRMPARGLGPGRQGPFHGRNGAGGGDQSGVEVIVATECGMLVRLAKDHPGKRFYPVKDMALCPNMKKVTLPKIVAALETMAPAVIVPPEIADRARRAIDRMIAL